MFCSKCGNQLPDYAQFCNECGTQTVTESVTQNMTKAAQTVQADPATQSECSAQTSAQSRQSVSNQQPLISVDIPGIKEKTRETFQKVTGQHIQADESPEYERYPHPYQKLGGLLGFMTYAQLIGAGLMALLFLISLFTVLPYIQYLGAWVVFLLLIQLAVFIAISFFCIKFFTMIRRKNPLFLRFYELTMISMTSLAVLVILLTGLNFDTESIRSLLSGVLGFVIWSTYFRKSVRVRTYMGSDAYLRCSIFFKNTIAPVPADIQPYIKVSCSKCGRAFTGKNEFCFACGEKRILASETPNQESFAFCSACGTKYSAYAEMCPVCSEPVSSSARI